ncbi:PilZ domain-containing protein [Aeromonas sobria]|uniref:PilZ domain-containing protein n=1 Tax=Aeromonas sobria TaxID=646 RepID=UPI003CFD9DFB
MTERRHFSRILYATPASLSQGSQTWTTQLVDVSLQGALLVRPSDWLSGPERDYRLSFRLAGSDIVLTMEVELSHEEGNRLGFYCHHMDIDSATHLKRMIELNVGDEALLHRELEQLLAEHLDHPHP